MWSGIGERGVKRGGVRGGGGINEVRGFELEFVVE